MQKQFVLKARETVKRVAAITAGATLLGATAMGAVAAADLGDYPAPFVADGSLVGLVVVGSDAAAGDIVGAGDIISTLTQAAVTTVAGTGETTVTGGISKDILIGTALDDTTAFGANGVDDDDVSTLIDRQLNIDIGSDKDYDVHEAIVFSSGASVESGTTTANPAEDFGTTTFLQMNKDSVRYRYMFDDAIEITNRLNQSTTNTPISITILGHDLEITGATDNGVSGATTDTVTVNLATEYFLSVGDSVVVGGKTVNLMEVGSSSVVVDVDGVTDVVDTTTKTVNGIKVRGESFFNKDEVGAGSATISIGEDISKTYTDGDEFIGEDEDNPNWVWEIADMSTGTPSLNVSWNQIVDDSNDDSLISVENGEAITLPNNYAQIYLNKYTQEDRQEYKVSVETGLELKASGSSGEAGDTAEITSGKAILFEATGASGDDAFTLNTTAGVDRQTDKVWAYYNSTGEHVQLYFWNNTNNQITYARNLSTNATWQTAKAAFKLDFKDTSLQISLMNSNTSGDDFTTEDWNWTIDDEGGHGDIVLNTEISSNAFAFLGETDGDTTTSSDLTYNGNDISGWDEDTRTERGFIISSYKDSDSADELMFSVPGDNADYDVQVIVSGTASTVSTTGGTTQVNSVAGVSVIKLDSEITDPASKNLILVGGPAVNSLTASALGLDYPTTGAASTIPENAATLRMVSNAFGGSNAALVVAGWDADDTRNAASVLQDYSSHASALAGNSEVEVRGSTVTAVGGDVTTA